MIAKLYKTQLRNRIKKVILPEGLESQKEPLKNVPYEWTAPSPNIPEGDYPFERWLRLNNQKGRYINIYNEFFVPWQGVSIHSFLVKYHKGWKRFV